MYLLFLIQKLTHVRYNQMRVHYSFQTCICSISFLSSIIIKFNTLSFGYLGTDLHLFIIDYKWQRCLDTLKVWFINELLCAYKLPSVVQNTLVVVCCIILFVPRRMTGYCIYCCIIPLMLFVFNEELCTVQTRIKDFVFPNVLLSFWK